MTHTIAMWDDVHGKDGAYFLRVDAETTDAALDQVIQESGLSPGGLASQGGRGETIHIAAWKGVLAPTMPQADPDASRTIRPSRPADN